MAGLQGGCKLPFLRRAEMKIVPDGPLLHDELRYLFSRRCRSGSIPSSYAAITLCNGQGFGFLP
jgi:hypothetical protein